MSVHLEQIKKKTCNLKQQLADKVLFKAKQSQEAVKCTLNRNDKKSVGVIKATEQPTMEIRKRQNMQQQQKQQQQSNKEINYNKFKTIVSLNKNHNNNQPNKIEQQQQQQRNLNNHLLLGDVEEEDEEEEEDEVENEENEENEQEAEEQKQIQTATINTDVPQSPFLMNEVSNVTNKIIKRHNRSEATKRSVYFDLPELLHNKELILSKNQQQQQRQQQQKLQAKSMYKQRVKKNIIFNGTFPIDLPLQSRFKTTTTSTTEYDAEANASVAELKYAHTMNDYDLAEAVDDNEQDDDEEDDDDDDDDEEFEFEAENDNDQMADGILKELGILKSRDKRKKYLPTADEHHHAVWSMQELIDNPSIPLNYQKMCNEVEHSLSNFEKYLDAKSAFKCNKSKTVRTFEIDGPVYLDNNKKQM